MVSEHFRSGVVVRTALLLVTVILLSIIATRTTWYVSMGLLALAVAAETLLLINYASRWSNEVTRFLNAVTFDDASASFGGLQRDSAFGELGATMARVLDRLRKSRSEREEQAHYLTALINHVPVALISVGEDGKLTLLNFAARRLFEGVCARTSDLPRYGEAFAVGLENMKPGDGQILRMERKTGALQLKANATDLTLSRRKLRLISLQNIQTELTANELAAWQTVIRVMAHEVMNSLTPVTSLAATAQGLVRQAAQSLPADDVRQDILGDAAEALETMTKRSEGLLHFVQNHRRLTKRMIVTFERLRVERVFARLKRLLASDLEERGIALVAQVEPANLEVNADPELLDQLLINLMRNAIDALRDTPEGRITLSAAHDVEGRAVIHVTDNGPGIAPEQRDKVFVPFFTTKRNGSGVGLTLARQIATVHGGTIAISEPEGGGARISIRF